MVAPASHPVIPPQYDCTCKVEHLPDGSGSRLLPDVDCPTHTGGKVVGPTPQPLPAGLAGMVLPAHVETGEARDAAIRRRQDALRVEWERLEALRKTDGEAPQTVDGK